MIEASFQKDFTSEYMIIMAESDEIDENHYEIQMLQNNNICGLLQFQSRKVNEHLQFFYNIKGFVSMTDLLEREKYIGIDIAGLMTQLHQCVENLDQYLLEKSALNLDEHFIYYHTKLHTFAFTYIPGYYQPTEEQIKNLLSWMMKHIDYKRKSDVNLVYEIYRKIENNEPYIDLFSEENTLPDNLSGENPPLHINHLKVQHSKDKVGDSERERFQMYTQWCKRMCLITAGIGVISFAFRRNLYIWMKQQMSIDLNEMLVPMIFLICCAVFGILIIITQYMNMMQKEKKEKGTKEEMKIQTETKAQKEKKTQNNKDFWDEEQVIDFTSIRENQTSVLQPYDLHQREDLEYFMETVLLERKTILQLISEQDKEVINVSSFPFTIGKNEKVVQYCIDSDVVSRRHVQLTEEEQKYFITDLHSTNGTWINDKQLLPNRTYELHHDDIIKIADLNYEVKIKQAVSREVEL